MTLTVFPNVTGSNLLRQSVVLPGGLEGEYNLVLVAFQQWQQAQVDSWVPALAELEQAFPGLAAYELPTIYRMNPLSRWFLNEGMRAGIPNDKTRRCTITLYLDKTKFRASLGIAGEDEISVLLIDRAGQVYWRTTGVFEDAKAGDLVQALGQRIPPAHETRWKRR